MLAQKGKAGSKRRIVASKEQYVSIPWILFPVITMTELTRNSCILLAARLTGSDGDTTATLSITCATLIREENSLLRQMHTFRKLRILGIFGNDC